MLSSLDHIVLVCADIEAGVSAYSKLLGAGPIWRSGTDDTETALFRLYNTDLELVAERTGGALEGRFAEILGGREGMLTSLVFAADDIEAAHRRCSRRGLRPSDISGGRSTDLRTGDVRSWSRFRLDDAACAGVKTFILAHDEPPRPPEPILAEEGHVTKVDHLVINTPDPVRAIAHYGGKLGIDLRLDRTFEKFGARMLFFKIGGLVLEIIHRHGADAPTQGDDKIWGITWAVDDIEAAHARMSRAGLEISEVRAGRKPGTKVFTVKNGTMSVPTLILASEGRA